MGLLWLSGSRMLRADCACGMGSLSSLAVCACVWHALPASDTVYGFHSLFLVYVWLVCYVVGVCALVVMCHTGACFVVLMRLSNNANQSSVFWWQR